MKKGTEKALKFLSSLNNEQAAIFQDIVTELNHQILELKTERSKQYTIHSGMMETQNNLINFLQSKYILSEYYHSDYCK